ncbi:MAG: hypothetical protein WC981_03480 [Candidatus Dojkabacteria bacterium]
MNSSKKILIILSLVFSLFYGINSLIGPVEVRAQTTYNCEEELGPSATCDLPGGYIEGFYYIGWGDGCYYYAGRYSWSCSGTDNACTESRSRLYYKDENCTDDAHTGCCSTSGSGSSCTPDCGRQQCDWDVYNCDCGYYGCKVGDGDVADNPSCALCSEPLCTDPVCTPPSCPAPLVTNESDYYAGQTSCSNCKGTQTRSCYEVPSTPPTSSIQILPGGSTVLGCSSNTHTGTEVNNPINMVATFNDPNGASDIEAIYVWLKTQAPIPNTPQYINSTANSNTARTFTNNSWGFMMHKEGSSWVPYIVNRDTEWVKASYSNNRFAIKGPSSQNMVFVEVNGVTTSGINTVILNFDLDFNGIADSNKVADGNYNIFTMGNDVFGFTPYDNYTDGAQTMIQGIYSSGQIRFYNSWVASNKVWSFDFTNPEVSSPESTVSGPTNIRFGWSVQDAIGLYAVVGNIYVSDTVEKAENITEAVLTSTGVKTTINPYLPQRQGNTGDLRDGYIAKAINIGGITQNGSLNMNIGANREGSLIYHTTVFDNACNTNQSYSLFNLEDWIVTYGGLVYSSGGIEFSVKDVENPDIWNPVALLNKIKPAYADISSELYGTASTNPSSLKKSLLTKSFSISPFKGFKGVDYYKDVKNTFERREIGIPNITKMGNTVSLEGNLGIPDSSIKVLDRIGNLTVGTPSNAFTCNGKGIIFVSGNLTIENNILNSNRNSDACIFVVKGNVIINQGSNSSGGSIGYDEINAYILTNGTVTITGDSSLDGLYISGGIQSLGGINTIGRYLGLSYRDTHPVLVINHHSKYGIFSSTLIGNPVDMVKIEVGFKPY